MRAFRRRRGRRRPPSEIFFQPQNWAPSIGGPLWPQRPRKALIRSFRFFGFPTQKMLEYHWVLLKPCSFSQSNHINDPSRRISS